MFSPLSNNADAPTGDVQIWSANLDAFTASEQQQLSSSLDLLEHRRADRFHFERDRSRYIAARGLLRHLLAAELQRKPSEILFGHGENGKPELREAAANRRMLRFNISHSEAFAMFALGWDRHLGVDLEAGARLGATSNLAALAGRILSPNELERWEALADDLARRSAFLRAWTRKEAYAKATGRGIFDQLSSLELILDCAAPRQSIALDGWLVFDLKGPEGIAAAIAIQRD